MPRRASARPCRSRPSRTPTRKPPPCWDSLSAIGAYGGFFIPKSYGTSIALTGSADAALYAFIVFYVTCIVMTWWYYSRKNAPMPC